MKIGVGVITCNRQPFFEKCVASLPKVDELVVVNDGKPYKLRTYPGTAWLIEHTRNMGVATSKNEALRYLIDKGCDHLFLIEDDIVVKNQEVFNKYIETASVSGIWHLNYALHGSYNKDEDGNPKIKYQVEYKPGVEVAFYHNITGALSYYLKGIIKNVGYMDERYHNAFEHVDHTYRIIQKGLHPPFWYFADIANSGDYLEEQAENFEESVIRNETEFAKNFHDAMGVFQYKFGTIPQKVPETQPDQAIKILEEIQTNYAKPL